MCIWWVVLRVCAFFRELPDSEQTKDFCDSLPRWNVDRFFSGSAFPVVVSRFSSKLSAQFLQCFDVQHNKHLAVQHIGSWWSFGVRIGTSTKKCDALLQGPVLISTPFVSCSLDFVFGWKLTLFCFALLCLYEEAMIDQSLLTWLVSYYLLYFIVSDSMLYGKVTEVLFLC